MNELSKIFHLIGIDTNEVLAAAGTKWNFLPFKPGLVGGHCIGVDPYYLIRKAEDYGFHPGLILYGRRINDTMGEYIAGRVVKCMIKKDVPVRNAEALVLGFTFKENCPDVRNSKVGDVVRYLGDYGINVTICDPWARPDDVRRRVWLECPVHFAGQEVRRCHLGGRTYRFPVTGHSGAGKGAQRGI